MHATVWRCCRPTFTTAQARRAGLASPALATLVSEGAELSRGVYRRSDTPETAHLDLQAVHTRASHAIICGESALALHELIDDIPAYTSQNLAALGRYLRTSGPNRVADLQRIAREMHALSVIRPAVEAVLA